VRMALAGCGKGPLHCPLGVSGIGAVGSMTGKRPALPGSQLCFFELGHAAVPTGIQCERRRETEAMRPR